MLLEIKHKVSTITMINPSPYSNSKHIFIDLQALLVTNLKCKLKAYHSKEWWLPLPRKISLHLSLFKWCMGCPNSKCFKCRDSSHNNTSYICLNPLITTTNNNFKTSLFLNCIQLHLIRWWTQCYITNTSTCNNNSSMTQTHTIKCMEIIEFWIYVLCN